MFDRVIQNVINVSPSEMPRTIYSWALRFIFYVGLILGWTVVIAISVSRFSISFLPILFLLQAVFTIIGMLLFSLLVDRVKTRTMILLNTVLAVISLIAASFSYENSALFLIFALMANGMFLPQVGMLLSTYIEDYFTPTEASRVFPVIETAEILGGIIGGIVLVFVGTSLMGYKIFWLWILCLLLFLVVLFVIDPKLPHFMEFMERITEKGYKPKMSFNVVHKGISLVKKMPFLQVMIVVMALNWIVAMFIEFQFTRAIDSMISPEHSMPEHEKLLAHGLGALNILFHGSALLVEMFLAGRLLKRLGTFGAFFLHVVMTIMSAFSLIFAYGYFTSVLAKNNFELTKGILKNAYETTYYAYGYGTQKLIREFVEGLLFPLATIVGTLMIIGIQAFFLKEDYFFVIQFLLLFFGFCMMFFTFQLKKSYTDLNVKNLSSGMPLIKSRAVEILGQKGHENAAMHLIKELNESNDVKHKKRIIKSLSNYCTPEAMYVFLEIVKSQFDELKKDVLIAIAKMKSNQKKGDKCDETEAEIVRVLKQYLDAEEAVYKIDAVKALSKFDIEAIKKYLYADDREFRALASILLWEKRMYRKKIKEIINESIESGSMREYWALACMAGHINDRELKKFIMKNLNSHDEEIRLIALLGALKMHKYYVIPMLRNLLLYGNQVIFNKGLIVLGYLSEGLKIHVAKSLMPYEEIDTIPNTNQGLELIARLKKIYRVCNATDEISYMDSSVKRLMLLTNKIK